MPKTRSQSSTGRPGPAGPPPEQRLASSVEAGERLYRQAMSRSRSVNDERDLSDVPAPVAAAVTPTTEAVVDPEVVGPQEEDDLRMEVRRLKSDAHQALVRQDDGKQVSASVKTIREDLNRLLERYGNTPDALPGLTVDVEEVLTLVYPRLERLERAVHEQTAAKPVVLEEKGAPLKEARSKKSKSRRKKGKSARDSSDESSSTEGFSSSTDDSDDSDTSDDDDSDDGHRRSRSRKKNTSSWLMRKKGSPYRGLKVLPCTNPLYRKVLNYRYYCLKVKSKKRSGRETVKVKDHIKRLKIGLNDLTFDGKTPILVTESLTRFVAEADTLEMSEPQAFVSLPHFLKGLALEQYRSVCRSLPADESGFTSWPEAVQYFLCSYKTSNAIRQAILDLRDVTQKPEEGEAEYSSRLYKASVRCGNVHSTEDKITLYIDGLDPSIKSLVALYR
ncbi:unnamed protein product [Agarophyton chilense]